MKRAITEHELEALVKDGTVVVDREMLLTPSAREFAMRKGIKLVYSTEKTTAEMPASTAELARLIEDLVVKEVLGAKASAGTMPSGGTSTLGGSGSAVATAATVAAPPSKVDRNQLNDALASLHEGDTALSRALVTIVGRNRPGVVAAISSAVAGCGGDLADMNQTIVGDYFSLIFVVDLQGLATKGVSFRVFKEKLLEEEARLGCVKILVMHEGIFSAMHKV